MARNRACGAKNTKKFGLRAKNRVSDTKNTKKLIWDASVARKSSLRIVQKSSYSGNVIS